MNIDQQIADIRIYLDAAIDNMAGNAHQDITALAIKARQSVGKIMHFEKRSAGQKNRWAKRRVTK